jgi:hypothetical protein
MNAIKTPETIPPPRLIGSLRSGFDTVANHIGLIIFPLLLDLFLWLGPHYQLKSLFTAIIEQTTALMSSQTAQVREILETSNQFWAFMADHFNLASSLRSYPVGIPSLMAGRSPVSTPFGTPALVRLDDLGMIVLSWMAFSLLGLVLGSLYFYSISSVINGKPGLLDLKQTLRASGQTLLLTLCWILFLLAINIPAMFLLSILAMLSSGIAQLATILYSIILVWVIVPLMFSPHGIYYFGQNAITSILTSMRLVRYILPGTGLFFLAAVLLSQGLDLLWETPHPDSWMTVVGIGGHAFISTAMVTASFFYYRDAMKWVQEFLQRKVMPTTGTTNI